MPRRLLAVERMRRAYFNKREGTTADEQAAEEGSTSRLEPPDFASTEEEKREREEEEVDQLMLWVHGLASEEESEAGHGNAR